MRIVICDDNPEVLRELERLFLKYGGSRSDAHFEIKTSSDISVLLHRMQQKETADIYVLDTTSSQMTGIEMEDGIRKNSSKMLGALEYALSRMEGGKEAAYLVKTKGGIESIPYSEIEFIENVSRRLEVHLTGHRKITSIYIRRSFEEEIRELVEAGNFICTHKSFLINMDYVRALGQNAVVMESGISVPVSRKYSLDVKKKSVFRGIGRER